MRSIKIFWMLALVVFILINNLIAQQATSTSDQLNKKQQSIVTIAAFTAKGDMVQLQKALNTGLDAALTVNEIKEILVQLYAYAGFPRSLNALHSLMDVLKERKSKGIDDPLGKESSLLPTDKSRLQFGTEIQTKLLGQPVKGEVYQFAPAIDQFLKEHLFGDIFGRDNLDWKTRELATIAALASLGGVDNQLRSHYGVGLYNGLTEKELKHLVSIIQSNVGAKEGNTAKQVLQTVLERQNSKATIDPEKSLEQGGDQLPHPVFPKGDKITNNNFTGTAFLQILVPSDTIYNTQIGNVTFQPGARTNWHLHPAGQILLVTNGTGYYQERGKPKKVIRAGDVIQCLPGTTHWHGASRNSAMSHIAIGPNTQKGSVLWLEPVTDKEFDLVSK